MHQKGMEIFVMLSFFCSCFVVRSGSLTFLSTLFGGAGPYISCKFFKEKDSYYFSERQSFIPDYNYTGIVRE